MITDGMGFPEYMEIYMTGKQIPKQTDLLILPIKKEHSNNEKGVAYHDNRNNH